MSSQNNNSDNDDLLKDFLEEAFENLTESESLLINLKEDPTHYQIINDIFRPIHTLKGNSSYLNYESVKKISHEFESTLDFYRKNPKLINRFFIETGFEIIDALRFYLSQNAEAILTPQAQDLIDKIAWCRFDYTNNQKNYNLTFNQDQLSTKNNASQQQFVEGQDEFIKIKTQLIEKISNSLSDLSIFRNSLNQSLVDAEKQKSISHHKLEEIKKINHQLSYLISDLVDDLHSSRLVSIQKVFTKLPRIIRDLCLKTGKNVELKFEGDDIKIDKNVIDTLSEPIIHILRNALDHGIETNEQRQLVGKSEMGLMTISAQNVDQLFRLTISDDGAGIDADLIVTKALEKKLITKEQSMSFSYNDKIQLIFESGFSTSEQVTEISGRGVGLDVVKTAIKKMKGQIRVISEKGIGTQFVIDLPPSYSVTEALIVESDQTMFAIPIDGVKQIVNSKNFQAQELFEKQSLSLNRKVIPIVGYNRTSQNWSLIGSQQKNELKSNAQNKYLIIGHSDRQLALKADKIFHKEELVIKNIPSQFDVHNAYMGAALLGDGQNVLIIDPFNLEQLSGYKKIG